MSPLGETLRRARLSKGITIEDAERVTRIPRKYLEALEVENYGILPAPVYARGFLRSTRDWGNPSDLLPFFPVGHVEEPKLEPAGGAADDLVEPEQRHRPGVVAFLIVLVIALYSIGARTAAPRSSTGRRSSLQRPIRAFCREAESPPAKGRLSKISLARAWRRR
jgi:hypothetical protein